jgi:hypothetical protein
VTGSGLASLFLGFVLTAGRPSTPFRSFVFHGGHPGGGAATALCLASRKPFHYYNRRIYVLKFLAQLSEHVSNIHSLLRKTTVES